MSLRSWLLQILPTRRRLLGRLHLGWLGEALINYVNRSKDPISLPLHGFNAWINPGNPYPFILAEQPGFNRPLVELVTGVSCYAGRPLAIADVGASLGNTVLLLMGECRDAVGSLHCVEGDTAFFNLLRKNCARFSNVALHHAMLARRVGEAKELVYHHPGTAGASGEKLVPATTLDRLLLDAVPHLDVLKIDIDGSDGEALAGAAGLLERDQPAVIFEWHPYLVQQTGHDAYAAFEALQAARYTAFLWFNNKGMFSHFSTGERTETEKWRRYLVAMHPHGDPHFDVVALPAHLLSLELPLASFGVAY